MGAKRALLSVSDKTGLVEFARVLSQLGFELISTGGTHQLLRDHGIAAREVADVTGFPEIMDGRVKTLHPKIHGGLLGRRGTDDAVMQEQDITPIELLVVNLYPFEQTVAKPGCTREEAIENIDVGGPAMVRAAAKNHAHVTVLVDPADYPRVWGALKQNAVSPALREALALKAFAHTSRYDAAVAAYLGSLKPDGTRAAFPSTLGLHFDKRMEMRYGENPHQRSAFYAETRPPAGSIAGARLLQGKELSYNNIADADAALECVKQLSLPACAIVKHANPCGVAEHPDGIQQAYDLAHRTDPNSAYGGIIAFNRPLDGATIWKILDRQFVEVIVAPSISDDALRMAQTKPNVRLLATGTWPERPAPFLDFKRVGGGLLVQDGDIETLHKDQLKVVTKRAPTEAEMADLVFAWHVVKFVKSNAIVYARDRQTIGIGAGQMSRVYSAKIAGIKAADEGLEVKGSVMASDAFFPFRDGIDAAAQAGVGAVIQPGGSVRDSEVIEAADEHGLAMVFTGLRHFPALMRALDVTTSVLASQLRGWRGTAAFRPAKKQPAKPLELYEYEASPYCRLVREALTEMDIDAMIYPCPRGGTRFRPKVQELGGKQLYPYLVDPNTGTAMYESRDIVEYVAKTYEGRVRNPAGARRLAAAGMGFLAACARGVTGFRGYNARPSKAPLLPLELFSFESSPFSRLVREVLCELELPYLLRNTGKGRWTDMGAPGVRDRWHKAPKDTGRNRKVLFERTGRVQVPYLVDPNTKTEMYESADIIRYLEQTYAA